MAASISKLKPGTFSEPEIGYAMDGNPYYRIFYLQSETKPHVANLEQDWQRIQSLALDKKKDKELEIWTEKKRKETYINISKTYLNCGYFLDWNTKTK
jgi:peptidyl-prolyl cis-trans isomerase SurA